MAYIHSSAWYDGAWSDPQQWHKTKQYLDNNSNLVMCRDSAVYWIIRVSQSDVSSYDGGGQPTAAAAAP